MCIVGYDAETGVCREFLHDPAEGHLGGGGHCVCFVEDDEFVGCEGAACAWFGGGCEDLFCGGECFDLFAGECVRLR